MFNTPKLEDELLMKTRRPSCGGFIVGHVGVALHRNALASWKPSGIAM